MLMLSKKTNEEHCRAQPHNKCTWWDSPLAAAAPGTSSPESSPELSASSSMTSFTMMGSDGALPKTGSCAWSAWTRRERACARCRISKQAQGSAAGSENEGKLRGSTAMHVVECRRIRVVVIFAGWCGPAAAIAACIKRWGTWVPRRAWVGVRARAHGGGGGGARQEHAAATCRAIPVVPINPAVPLVPLQLAEPTTRACTSAVANKRGGQCVPSTRCDQEHGVMWHAVCRVSCRVMARRVVLWRCTSCDMRAGAWRIGSATCMPARTSRLAAWVRRQASYRCSTSATKPLRR